MNEYLDCLSFGYRILIALAFGLISAFGGRPGGRILKRLIAPLVFSLLILTLKFNSWFLLAIPAYALSASVGYGGDTWEEKFIRRTLWSLLRTSCAVLFVIFSGAWVLLSLQFSVGLMATLLLGIENPVSAPKEEGLINLLSVVFVPFMV